MHVDIKTKGIELTEVIRSAVEQRLAKLESELERFGTAVSLEAVVGKTTEHHNKGPFFRAELRVGLPGKSVYAEAENEDLYVAIREARDKARRQIVDYKGKFEDQAKVTDGQSSFEL
ncbi:ribosomal subunit interface protein [Candidatus Uhrbacteria bacterium CG_4_10_14_0_8_um_filter_58_22]|uniref:Ribosomal subunit interface protein n=1 Tax=Candidatus Uhrbacteria bacterium CG_4_10_14_0_8_um_filter_58_22 TaxID=1975029 RepID=A0A2M7QAZ2_9BACT|nr:MAG: ribosomal subunit interface protein [Parcubacteria group bacterium CG1_02_58_44]PIY63304.1 MAG: ribosomal subunit interface protein [Candidatus Uhrbacteria bacterium CG_4_10_14_0_8_um_filter_58_22]